MPNAYRTHEMGSEVTGLVSAAVGANTAFPNPIGGLQNAQKAYHLHQYGKLQREGMCKALANEERAIESQREMSSPQVRASSLTYGKNGITEENGWVQDSEGKITYQGK